MNNYEKDFFIYINIIFYITNDLYLSKYTNKTK